jgi:regulator of protease activity HflC (stomatin/prohibitin superfamily)
MDPIVSFFAAFILLALGYGIGATKIVNQGNKALVERLGKYHKTLEPGPNLIIPFLDRVAVEDTIREQVLDIPAQQAITKDNISVSVDAVVFWKVEDLYKAYYNVEDVERAIEELATTTLRSTIGELELDQTYSSRNDINRNLLQQLNEAAMDWGVRVMRVEVQEIKLPEEVLESLAKARAAETEKQAEIFKAQGTVESIEMISKALLEQSNTKAVLQYLIAQRYVEANQKLGESPNSKIVFMDPKALSEALTDLIGASDSPVEGANGSAIRPHDQ